MYHLGRIKKKVRKLGIDLNVHLSCDHMWIYNDKRLTHPTLVTTCINDKY